MKMKRADLHIRELEEAGRAFVQSNPFDIELIETRTSGGYLAVYIAKARVLKEPPAPEWGAIIGEVAHSLRSALDHLVWQLGINYRGAAPKHPLPQGSPWQRSAFPIFFHRKDFLGRRPSGQPKRGSGLEMLWGVDPALHYRIKDAQPYKSRPPTRDPLWLLHELANIDKHRHPPLLMTLVTPSSFGHVSAVKGQLQLTRAGAGLSPFENGVELARLKVISNPLGGDPRFWTQVHGLVDIAFPAGAPGYGQRVTPAMLAVFNKVQTILLSFDDQF